MLVCSAYPKNLRAEMHMNFKNHHSLVRGLPHVDGGPLLDTFPVGADLLVAVGARDRGLARDDAVVVAELDAVAVGREEDSGANELVVLKDGQMDVYTRTAFIFAQKWMKAL